jgi:hypothetical protein
MGGRCLVFSAVVATLACGGARQELRDLPEPRDPEPVERVPEPESVAPPLGIERAFAGAIPVAASAERAPAPALREAYLRVLTREPFRLVALRLDGICRAVSHGGDRVLEAAPGPGDVLRIGESPGCDYRVGLAVACPAPSDAPAWQSLLFYEAGGALRVLPFQFVHVGSVHPERSSGRSGPDRPREARVESGGEPAEAR